MILKKCVYATLSSVNLLPRRCVSKNILCANFYCKHGHLRYDFQYSYNRLKSCIPVLIYYKKYFSKTSVPEVCYDGSKNNDTDENLHEMATLLRCSRTEVENLLKEYPNLLINFDLESISDKISILLDKFPVTVIRKNIWLLEFSLDELNDRLKELDKWELDKTVSYDFLPLLKIPSFDFYRVSSKFIVEKDIIKEKNRIIFIASEMQCSVAAVVDKFLKFQSLLLRNFRPIKENIRLLKEYQITSEDLFQEFLVLNITPVKLKKRLEKLNKCGMTKHLWLIQCSEQTFDSKVENEIQKYDILNHWPCTEKYIAETLKLTPEEMVQLKIANPKLFKLNIVKIRNTLEFLLTSGYTTQQISQSPAVFHYSFLRIKERFSELRSIGIALPQINLLYVSQKYYDTVMERLKKAYLEKDSNEENTTKVKLKVYSKKKRKQP